MFSWFISFTDGDGPDRVASTFFHISPLRTRVVSDAPRMIHPGVDDHSGVVNDGDVIGIVDIIIVDVRAAKICSADKGPFIGGQIIVVAVSLVVTDARTNGCPAIVS